MGFRKTLASVAALTLVASPVAAQAAPREASPVEGEEIAGNPWIPIAVGVIVLAIILIIALDDETPDSP